MARVFIINGFAGSGKDKFVEYVTSRCQPSIDVANVHSSDRAKEALVLLNWSGGKSKETRRILAQLCDFGQARGVSEELINKALEFNDIGFFHERNPEQITRLLHLFPEAKTVFVVRDVEKQEEDIWGIEGYEYDYYIRNNASLQNLEYAAERFVLNNITGGIEYDYDWNK